ncbi:hypothetical protein CWO07_09305 [Vibrio splendidus]|uniref:Uncharacterized protein n=1 Tax=Vibrio splendidus TaxID=29497 RepID=A0A2T5EWZ2_VIBSP|nr:hypothetical protein CWO07_09305 [Vibrio splendidus]
MRDVTFRGKTYPHAKKFIHLNIYSMRFVKFIHTIYTLSLYIKSLKVKFVTMNLTTRKRGEVCLTFKSICEIASITLAYTNTYQTKKGASAAY